MTRSEEFANGHGKDSPHFGQFVKKIGDVSYHYKHNDLFPTIWAVHKDDPFGTGMLNWHSKEGYIGVEVDPAYHRQGIATNMYNIAVDKAKELGIGGPRLDNSNYSKMGRKWAESLGLPKGYKSKLPPGI